MYKVVHVPEDKDSFYYAFKVGVKEFSQVLANQSVQELKDLVATELEEEQEIYAHLISDGSSLDMTAHGIRQGWYHAGDLEIEVLAGAVDCEIMVFHEDGTFATYGHVVPGRPIICVMKSGPYFKGMSKLTLEFVLDVFVAAIAPYFGYF